MQFLNNKRTRNQIRLASQFVLATLIQIELIPSPIAWIISAFIFAWNFLKPETEDDRN